MNNLYFFSEEGDGTGISAALEFRVPANHKFDSGFVAWLAVAVEALLLRTEAYLYDLAGPTEN